MTIAILALLCVTGVSADTTPKPLADVELCRFARNRDRVLTKVTRKPVRISSAFSKLCIGPPSVSEAVERSPHADRWIDVFVSRNGVAGIRSGEDHYPVGTVILKEKKTDASNEAPTELFTGMLKRERGYNPECGDWEFFVMNGNAHRVLARGRIDSCIECHQAYEKSGFVVREYGNAETFEKN